MHVSIFNQNVYKTLPKLKKIMEPENGTLKLRASELEQHHFWGLPAVSKPLGVMFSCQILEKNVEKTHAQDVKPKRWVGTR